MKPVWIVEQDVFSEKLYSTMLQTFEETNTEYSIIKVKPFEHTIIGKLPVIPRDTPVVVYGSIGSQKLAKEHNWLPGVWTGPQFNMVDYAKNLESGLFLNHDFLVSPISNIVNINYHNFDEYVFIRPVLDSKEFAGQVMKKGEILKWYKNMLEIGYLTNNDFEVIISSPKMILAEYRMVVVDGKVVAASQYKSKHGIAKQQEGAPWDAVKVANKAISQFQPAPVFVIDIAQNEFGYYQVVEYNTFNSAGLYACNVKNIIEKINTYIESC